MQSKTRILMIAVGVVIVAITGIVIWSHTNPRSKKRAVKETYEDLVKSDHVDVNILLQGPNKTNV